MGGKGSGGARAGSGQKPKDLAVARVHGSRSVRGARGRLRPAAAVPVPIPGDLPEEQRAVWGALAPHALAARTLTPGTAGAFRDLCEAIVLKRSLLARIEVDGLTYQKISVDGAGVEHSEIKAHPLLSQHRGMMQRVEAGCGRFRLAPFGKEIVPTEPPADPFGEFDDVGTVQ